MGYSIFLFCFSALLSTLFTPLSIRTAHIIGAIDIPDGGRHRHTHPTPRLGGLAVFSAVMLCALLFPIDAKTGSLLAGGGLLAALGVSDDLYALSPRLKLSALLAIATLPVAFGMAPTALTLCRYSLPLSYTAGNIFTILWILLLTNAFNLIDGLDGLAASLAALGAVALFFLEGERYALLTAGALFGFLPYNRSAFSPTARKRLPARSFLGDTGALFVGYALAVLSLGQGTFSLALPFLFALPLLDLFRVFFIRALQAKNPFQADRSHFHHRFADRGLSVGEILLLAILITVFFILFAFLLQEMTQ